MIKILVIKHRDGSRDIIFADEIKDHPCKCGGELYKSAMESTAYGNYTSWLLTCRRCTGYYAAREALVTDDVVKDCIRLADLVARARNIGNGCQECGHDQAIEKAKAILGKLKVLWGYPG